MKQKAQQFAWAFYDWANSVYSLVITTSIFPLYFGAIIPSNSKVSVFGMTFSDKDILYAYAISFSFLIVVIVSPILSAIADKTSNKKLFLKIFCYLGSFSCAMLFFFTGENTLWIGMLFSILASVGFWGSLVYYNAYLPEISKPEERDALSAKGFSLGYLGSSILLIICLGLILGVGEHLTRYSFLLVAVWWIGFAQYTFAKLPKSFSKPVESNNSAYSDLINIGKSLFQQKNISSFLISFFCLSVGVQTIIYTATRFGDEELKIDTKGLIITILVIQFVAIAGAWLFATLSKRLGNIKAMQIALVVWAFVCLGAYLLDKNNPTVEFQFYTLGGFVGLVLGGIQSLSRSTYSKLIPNKGDNTIYFSFYDILEKIALTVGTFLYGFLIWLTESMRMSALSLIIFFVLAFVFLFFVKVVPSGNNYNEEIDEIGR